LLSDFIPLKRDDFNAPETDIDETAVAEIPKRELLTGGFLA
jgi:hypothetical protein